MEERTPNLLFRENEDETIIKARSTAHFFKKELQTVEKHAVISGKRRQMWDIEERLQQSCERGLPSEKTKYQDPQLQPFSQPVCGS